jgi:hypothetical protein
MTSCKKPGVAFWTTVAVVVVLVVYPLSFGPACWLDSRLESERTQRALQAVYWPIGALAVKSELAERAIRWYGELGMADGSVEVIFASPGEARAPVISLFGRDAW